ncbi:uracil-DNA glycosylase [bacterium]|nr:uracil-DNA glycosylase [candidate division CSSED10-310 bacterium]
MKEHEAAVRWSLRKYLEYQKTLGLEYVQREETSTGSITEIQEAAAGMVAESPGEMVDERPGMNLPDDLKELGRMVTACTKCELHVERVKVVFGDGNPLARLMFVGEGPGAEEDRQGVPFVGAAGQLLSKILQAMGFIRSEVYITNIVKCRPPQNREPLPKEAHACRPYLLKQLELIQPEVIVALGRTAAQNLLQTDAPLGRLRGRFHDLQGIVVMPTYHPAALLRYPENKRFVWADMKLVMAKLGKPVP